MNIFTEVFMAVIGYLKADWFILLIGILTSVSLSVYVDSEKLQKYIERNPMISVPGSVAFGAFTPLCACGTMAVLLSMFISAMPWGPVMAFLVSSPLTSPSEFLFQSAFFGSHFAMAVLVASIILGVSAGFIAHYLSQRTNFFHNQFRLMVSKKESCCNTGNDGVNKTATCCSTVDSVEQSRNWITRYKLDSFLRELFETGFKKILLAFVIFIAIGKVVEMMIPKEWIMLLFSDEKTYSIPLSATLGLPLYVSGSAALPLMKSFLNAGAGEGAMMAFLITGKATGVPVIAGMATILKKRAILYYVGFVYLGGILSGYVYEMIVFSLK